MQLGMIGLGRMGGNMVRRLLKDGHECVAFDLNPSMVQTLAKEGAVPASSFQELVEKLPAPRILWLMLPAAMAAQAAVAIGSHRLPRATVMF